MQRARDSETFLSNIFRDASIDHSIPFKTFDCVSCFPLHFFRALRRFLRALQQNRTEASLFVSVLYRNSVTDLVRV